ncbi:MAG: SLC13 family permease [Anaerolineales bacterium]|nr:SLC13 family permease [Anaerolineales bacterium]
MTIEIALMIGIIALAIVLFSLERVPPDVTAMGLMLLVTVSGLVSPEQAFAGFGSEVVLMILGLLILTAGLIQTGAVDYLGREILSRVGEDVGRFTLLLMIAAAALSAFMSNTGATAFFLPIILSISRQMKISPSRLLMPLAFASILASSVTLIGTSTNLVISGLMVNAGLEALGMFELSVVGLPILIAGLIYMMTIGKRLIPDRGFNQDYTEDFQIQPYLTEIEILPESTFAGKTLAESGLGEDLDITVIRIVRDGEEYLLPDADLCLQSGDVLLVEGLMDELMNITDKYGLKLKPRRKIEDEDFQSEKIGLFEVVLLPNSPMIGRSLQTLKFRERYKLQILGINRSGEIIHQKLSRIRLAAGDELLIQGDRNNLRILDRENTLRLIRPVRWRRLRSRQALTATLLFGGSITLAALEILPLAVAVLTAAFLAFVTRIITPEEAYRSVEWRVLILIGSMLALGQAMQVTGTAAFLAGQIVQLTHQLNPLWLLTGFFLLSMALTQPMSNQAAAVVAVPIAIQVAQQLGLNPRSFAVMIALGASASFMTPLEPAALLVYGPGNYKFSDFPRVGFLLTLLIMIISILLVPVFWPL